MSLAIVGAAHDNPDGTSRAKEIERCEPGDWLEFRPEPENPVDPLAVAVFTERGVQIGYVRAEQAQLMRAMLSRGGLNAIFQDTAEWGAIARVALDGSEPILPQRDDRPAAVPRPATSSDDADWWPDPVYDD